jgi:hypothetical protein
VTDTDARLWHPWLRINRVLGVMLRSSATGTAWERTPWHATQRVAWWRWPTPGSVKNPSRAVLTRLAKALGVKATELPE